MRRCCATNCSVRAPLKVVKSSLPETKVSGLTLFIAESNPTSRVNNLKADKSSKAFSGNLPAFVRWTFITRPASTSHCSANSKSLARLPCLTAPYMNFLFSCDNCDGIEFHTMRMRGTASIGACLTKLLSYDIRILFCIRLTSL